MKEPIKTYFRLGILQWMSYPRADDMLALKTICDDDFFDVIETKGYGERNAEAKKLLDQSCLTVLYGAHPCILGHGLNPNVSANVCANVSASSPLSVLTPRCANSNPRTASKEGLMVMPQIS